MKKIIATATLCAGLLGGAASAAPISFGALSSNSDGSTEIIKDTLNNRDWLRLDVLADLTYAQTLAATSAGGAYEGFWIAGIQEAQDFTDALLFGQTNNCTAADLSFVLCASGLSVDFNPLLGSNFGTDIESFAWFLSDNNMNQEVGFVNVFQTTPRVFKLNEWTSIEISDDHATGGSLANLPISWLVYRDHVAVVPVPAALPLILAGIGVFGLMKRRQRQRADT